MTQRGPVAYQNAAINKRAAQIGALVLVCFAAGVTIFFGKWAAVGAIFVGAVGVAIGWWAKQGKSVAPDYAGDESGGMAASTQLISVIEVLDVPAFILDDEGSVVAHNRLVRELFPRIATSKPLSHVSRNPDLLRAIDEASAERKVRTLQIVDRVTQGRRLFASVSPLQSTNEQKNGGSWPIRRFLLIQFRDLTEQDRLAQMRSDFIANASHELRTPLAA